MTEMKTCTICENEYPATTEFFSPVKRKTGVKLINQCRKCLNTKDNARYHNVTKNDPVRMEHLREVSRINNSSEKRKEYCRNYKKDNREHLNEIERNWRKKNPEKSKEIKERWLRANGPSKLESCKKYRINNVEKVKETNKNYRQTERGKELGRIFSQIRWTKKKDLECTFTTEQWKECKNHFANSCCYCGEREEDNTQGFVLEQDHFIALNNKGPYTKENVVPSCKACNISKLDHFFFNWYHTKPFYSLERENKILDYLNSQGKPIQQLTFAI